MTKSCFVKKILLLGFFQLFANIAFAQITYKVALDADKITYRIFIKSSTAFIGNQARIGSAQITILVPHGNPPNNFITSNLKGKVISTVDGDKEMLWSSTRVNEPTENKPYDYISFGFNGSASPILFDIPANTEIEVLNFKNTGVCTGAVVLFENETDPFRPPNSVNSNPGNNISVAGQGFGNAYSGNFGGAANCQNTNADITPNATGASTITAGSTANLALNMSNIGNATSTGNINLTLNLPSGITFSSASGSNWTFSSINPSVINFVYSGIIQAGGNASALSVVLSASNSLSNGAVVNINGSVSGGGEVNISNNNFSWSPTIQNSQVDLSLSLSGSSNITAGVATNYTVNLTNIGNANTSGNYLINTTLPAGMTYNSASGNGWSCTPNTQNNGSTLVSCQSSAIINGAGNAIPLIINATPSIALSQNTTLVINSSVSGGGDNSPLNNSGSFSSLVSVVPAPNLAITMAGLGSVTAGSQTTYNINVSNIGNITTSGIYTVITTLPAGVSFVSNSGNGWNCSSAINNGITTLTCNSSTPIASNGSGVQLQLIVSPSLSLPSNSIITLNSSISGAGDTTPNNNSASFSSTILMPVLPNLSVNLTGSNNILVNNPTNYTFNISNFGNGATTGLYYIATTIPSGFTYNSYSGNGWTCSTSPQGQNTLLNCQSSTTIGQGSNGTPLIVNLTPLNSVAVGTILTINGNITGGGNSNHTNNTFNFSSTIISNNTNADLTVNITGTQNITPGTPTNYTIQLSNIGTGNTLGSYFANTTIPAGLSYNSYSGNGWTCTSTPQGNGSTILACQSSTTISQNGNAIPLIINVIPSNSLPSNTVLGIYTIISGGGDNSANNNSFTFNATVISTNKPDLTVNVQGNQNIQAGSSYNYNINVNNTGNASTNGFYSVSTSLPQGLTYNSYSGNGWACTSTPNGNNTLVSCQNNSTISVGGLSNVLVLNISAISNLAGNSSMTINSNVSGGGESNTANNTASIILTVQQTVTNPYLTVVMTGPNTITPNVPNPLLININNSGNGPSNGIYNFQTILPSGISYSSFSGTGWTCTQSPQANNNTLVACQSSTPIPQNGGANPLTINIVPTGTTINTQIISTITGGGSTNTNNNSYTYYMQLTNLVDLSASILVNTKTPNINQNITFTVTVKNDGSIPASGVVSQVILPNNGLYNITYSVSLNGVPQIATFNPNNGTWTIGQLNPGQAIVLTINGTTIQKGVFFALVEIISHSPNDIDSIPNNGSENEDDFDRTCYSVPIVLCQGESYKVQIPSAYTNIQWKKDGISLPSETSNSLTITQAGNYNFTSNVSCPKGGCCDIIVQQGNAPTIAITQPSPTCGNFNLASVLVKINNNITQVGLSYYLSQNEANLGMNPMTNTSVGASGTYWVRYQAFGDCSVIGQINVQILPKTSITVENIVTCQNVMLNTIQVLANGVAQTNGISFYFTQTDAQNATNVIQNPSIGASGVYWVRCQSQGGCFSITNFQITINSGKPLQPNVNDYAIICPATSLNLLSIQPTTPSLGGGKYEWRVSSSPNAPLVQSPTSVGGGTYYLFEKGPNGCLSEPDMVNISQISCCKVNICVPFTVTKN